MREWKYPMTIITLPYHTQICVGIMHCPMQPIDGVVVVFTSAEMLAKDPVYWVAT